MPVTSKTISDACDQDLVDELEFRGYRVMDPVDVKELCDPNLLSRAIEYAQRGNLSLAQFYLMEAVPRLHPLRAVLQQA